MSDVAGNLKIFDREGSVAHVFRTDLNNFNEMVRSAITNVMNCSVY